MLSSVSTCRRAIRFAALSAFTILAAGPAAAQKDALPDLTITSLSLSPTTLNVGDRSITMNLTMRNNGPGTADLRERVPGSGFRNQLIVAYAKQNGTGPDTPVYSTSFYHTTTPVPFGPGASRSFSWTTSGLPTFPAGSHTICVAADPDNLVPETNERNNRRCAKYQVVDKRGRPDLTVAAIRISPTTLRPGATVAVKLSVKNMGTGPAAGTDSAGANGYMVDVTMGGDTSVPAGFAVFSAVYSEDVLLRGGRFSRTSDLAPGASRTYGGSNLQIPTTIKPGRYYVCGYADAGLKIAETNEANNVRCTPLTVTK